MFGYILRRLLWMVPTFVGILLINFMVLRLQSPSLTESLSAGGGVGAAGSEAGDRSAEAHRQPVENGLARLRMTGRDLPALLNLRGFLDRDDLLGMFRRIDAASPTALPPSKRMALENDIWIMGRFAVQPLAAILADQELIRYHGPAAMALSLCAYIPLIPGDEETYSADLRREFQQRNRALVENRLAYRNDPELGFMIIDDQPVAQRKRERLLEIVAADPGRYAPGTAEAWKAIVVNTGFVDFFAKLLTLELYSESKKANVFVLIGERWWLTFGLNILSILIAWGVSVPLGIRSARRVGTLEDRATTTALFAAWSLPSFFVGTVLLVHLCADSSIGVRLFPNKGLVSDDVHWYNGVEVLLDAAWHWFLPLLVLSYASFTALSRYMRGNILDNLGADYSRTAYAKGCSEDQVVYGHVLRNSMITMITLGSTLLAELFGGFIIVESIFSIEGLGKLTLDAARAFDAPLVMASVVVSVLLLLVSILLADILYAVVDPRIRSRYGA